MPESSEPPENYSPEMYIYNRIIKLRENAKTINQYPLHKPSGHKNQKHNDEENHDQSHLPKSINEDKTYATHP